MVESSVGLVILLFLVFGIIEFSQLIMARQLLNHAVMAVGRIAAVGDQPATYSDGTPTPAPGQAATPAFLNTYVTKALAAAPLTNVTASFYGSNSNGSGNTSIAWNAMPFGQGVYATITGTYVPLFSGNRIYATSSGYNGPMVGTVTLTRTVFVRTEANNNQ